MIIADSNIFIDLWQNKKTEYQNLFLDNIIIITGIIKVELLQGAKDINSYQKINKILDEFHCIDTNDLVFWNNLSLNAFKLKSNGVTVPIQDIMISTTAIDNNLPILTNDKHFQLIQKVLTNLKLFL